MNFAKAQAEIKSKYPIMYHKYSFRGEVRTYKNILAIVDDAIVKYLGTTTRYSDFWNKIKAVPATPAIPANPHKLAIKTNQSFYPIQLSSVYTRKNKWILLTEKILENHPYKGKCCYCEIDLYCSLNYTRDHVLPRSKGGKGLKNLKPCCCHCNSEKGDLLLQTYIQRLNYSLYSIPEYELERLQTKIKNANKLAGELN